MSILVLFSFQSQLCPPVFFILFIVPSKVVSRVRFLVFNLVESLPHLCGREEFSTVQMLQIMHVLSLHIYNEVQLYHISKCQGRVFAVMTKCTMSGITFQ